MQNELLGPELPNMPSDEEATSSYAQEKEYQNIETGVSKSSPVGTPGDQSAKQAVLGSAISQQGGVQDDDISASLPQVADDLDLIEKEWVEKAKHIVAMTVGDPYQQNKQLGKVKANYIKKRYNKVIKLSE